MTKWEELWENGATFWEMNRSPPALIDVLSTYPFNFEHGSGLVPGCGSGHDAVALAMTPNVDVVTGIDIVPLAVERATSRVEDHRRDLNAEKVRFVIGDFFALSHDKQYDIVVDHTFLCAIEPSKRPAWARKMAGLVRTGGYLVAYMFPLANHTDGPPFGLSVAEYDGVLLPAFENVFLKDVPVPFHTWKKTNGEKVAIYRRVES